MSELPPTGRDSASQDAAGQDQGGARPDAHKTSDLEFTRLATSRGWLSVDAAQRALAEADRSAALGMEKTVGEILLEIGELDAARVKSLREALGWTLRSARVGDYQIVRRIGLGGMGVVFEARHVRLGQKAALKVLYPRLAANRSFRELLFREARVLARLHHPNLVHPIDFGSDGDYYYLALELIEGEDLLQRVERLGSLEPRESLDVVRDVLRALGALEKRGLIHGDVKPSNILLDVTGRAKLADLGLMRRAGTFPPGRRIHGTPQYLSPELIRGGELVDTRSDLYALGATWFHLVCGRTPFVGVSREEILRRHLSQPVEFPPSGPAVPADVAHAIRRLLSKDVASRPESCQVALEQLENLRSAKVSVGPRVPPRHRRGLVVLAVGVLALVGVYFGKAWYESSTTQVPDAPMATLPPDTGEGLASPSSDPSRDSLRDSVPSDGRVEAGTPRAAPESGHAVEGWGALTAWFRWVAASSAAARREATLFVRSLSAGPSPGASVGSPGASTTGAGTESERLTAPGEPDSPGGDVGAEVVLTDRRSLLGRTFHATRLGWGSEPYDVLLEYDFLADRELRDFRGQQGAWEVGAGELRRRSGNAAVALATVPWFRLPLSIDIASRGGKLRLAFGGEPLDFTRSGQTLRLRLHAAGSAPEYESGQAEVVTLRRGVEEGRLELFLQPEATLVSLRIEGELDSRWAAARLAIAQQGE